MATFILKWNPAISSYRTINYLSDMEWLISGGATYMNWSVWDYKHIKEGDSVFLLKVGNGPAGIVAQGIVTSRAYKGEDWSGKNRKTYYVDFDPIVMISPDCAPILDSVTLQNAIPDFDWTGGHSGIMLTPEQADILDNVWNHHLQESFPGELKSKAPTLFVKSKEESSLPKVIDKEAVEIGERLYRYITLKLKASPKYGYGLHSNMGTLMGTVSFLLEDYPESPACAYSNLECTKHILWTDYKFLSFLQKAVESLSIIQDNGGVLPFDLDKVRESLKRRQAFSDYITEAEDKAEHGEIMEDLRDLIDGYDIINEQMGSFHDSELLSMIIDHEGNYVELKIHMCNGADEMLTLRLEGHIEYKIAGDGDCVCMYLYGGYFYRFNNRICLDLDPLGVIEADHVRVISFTPCEDD